MDNSALQILKSIAPEPFVIYDGECPFCSRFVRWTRLRDAIGKVTLIDARSIDGERLEAIRALYDLDQGMIFAYGGQVHWGADAVHVMSLLSQRSNTFNRLLAATFRHRWLSNLLYPILRLGRSLTLTALRRKPIFENRNDRPG